RFFSEDAELLAKIIEQNLNAFVYCDANGEILPEFPINPNGSVLNLAGISNPAGNVCALMPHPERTEAGDPIFVSMRKWITSSSTPRLSEGIRVKTPTTKILAKPKFDVEFFVSLKITDNETLSAGKATDLQLKKFRWFGLDFGEKLTPQIFGKMLEKIIRGGDLLNPEKEDVFVKLGGKIFKFSKIDGFVAVKFSLPKNRILVKEKETSLDESRIDSVNKTLGNKSVKNLVSGMLWSCDEDKSKFEQATKKNFFHHPSSHNLLKI
ncbi:phosphoribosylformylglycinamidine synthase subunit PurQ, partial [Candidatus Gracilibacteria bacterium]|nr:phosphoribosylformylglycinamidine synthase subunit PurQ [Candidatus Gracilibacteria bacterium]